MKRAIVVHGRLSDPRHIELDEPITELTGAVEIVVQASLEASRADRRDVFELIAGLKPAGRSKEDIDSQIREERAAWGDR